MPPLFLLNSSYFYLCQVPIQTHKIVRNNINSTLNSAQNQILCPKSGAWNEDAITITQNIWTFLSHKSIGTLKHWNTIVFHFISLSRTSVHINFVTSEALCPHSCWAECWPLNIIATENISNMKQFIDSFSKLLLQ